MYVCSATAAAVKKQKQKWDRDLDIIKKLNYIQMKRHVVILYYHDPKNNFV